jgi:hypothetical protein
LESNQRPTDWQVALEEGCCDGANIPAKDYCREKDCVQEERMAREQINIGIKLPGGLPYTDWSKQQMVGRRIEGDREKDPHTFCKPPNLSARLALAAAHQDYSDATGNGAVA